MDFISDDDDAKHERPLRSSMGFENWAIEEIQNSRQLITQFRKTEAEHMCRNMHSKQEGLTDDQFTTRM